MTFNDSIALAVCENTRIPVHQMFAGAAKRGKTRISWFFGFKLHLVMNHQGEMLSFCLTPGNVDNHKPVEQLTRKLWGKVFGIKATSVKDCKRNSKLKG
ncbi:transposase [Adhaeribacter radiodurans]|uniref:Transposase n=1 Tax=Adhaeribacter radiodurans TaxID=2745197 RepID=A0A7L7LF15_9BACT|nr:transposase [Adhaeribacter radiodurans]